MLMKMPDGENKTMGMQEMTSAKSSMSQKDMAGCQDHMNKAMKMGMMKQSQTPGKGDKNPKEPNDQTSTSDT
jgi:hypothetical protein